MDLPLKWPVSTPPSHDRRPRAAWFIFGLAEAPAKKRDGRCCAAAFIDREPHSIEGVNDRYCHCFLLLSSVFLLLSLLLILLKNSTVTHVMKHSRSATRECSFSVCRSLLIPWCFTGPGLKKWKCTIREQNLKKHSTTREQFLNLFRYFSRVEFPVQYGIRAI